MDSTAALNLPDIPKSLLVVGGGYIGLELGSVYAALGSAVTVVEMTPGLLPGADRDLVDVLAQAHQQDDEGRAAEYPRRADEGRAGTASASRSTVGAGTRDAVFDRVLVAVGPPSQRKRPRPRPHPGQVSTSAASSSSDEQMRTAEPSIFAIGDVVGEPMLAHKASHEGAVAVEVIAGQKAVFAPRGDSGRRVHRSRAGVGRAHRGAGRRSSRPDGDRREVSRGRASGRAITLDRADGLTKLFDRSGDRAYPGRRPGRQRRRRLIAEAVVAIEMGATASDLKLSIHPHPTLTETLMEAAEVFFGQSTHPIYKPKRERRKAWHRAGSRTFAVLVRTNAARPVIHGVAAPCSPTAVGRYQRRGRPMAPGGSAARSRDST